MPSPCLHADIKAKSKKYVPVLTLVLQHVRLWLYCCHAHVYILETPERGLESVEGAVYCWNATLACADSCWPFKLRSASISSLSTFANRLQCDPCVKQSPVQSRPHLDKVTKWCLYSAFLIALSQVTDATVHLPLLQVNRASLSLPHTWVFFAIEEAHHYDTRCH